MEVEQKTQNPKVPTETFLNNTLSYGAEYHDNSSEEIEEFSSFDISDNNSSKHSDELDQYSKEVGVESSRQSTANSNSNIAIMSTPKSTETKHMIENNTTPKNEINKKTNIPESTKPSSRMSSDTFETPHTIETRASTMTSNPPSEFKFNKVLHYDLNFPAATLERDATKSTLKKEQKNSKNKILVKRLSRQNNSDISMGKESDYSSALGIQPIDSLFEKLSLNNHDESSSDFNPSNIDIVELQNQLTNYKIQLKLMNDLLRDKIYQSIGDVYNKQELSEEVERQIFNSLNSSKLKFQLNQLNNDYYKLKQMYDSLLTKNTDLNQSIEMLRDQQSDQENNQHEWQEKINNLVIKIRDELSLKSPTKINEFNDILDTLSQYINLMLVKLSQLKQEVALHVNTSKEKSDDATQLLQTVNELKTEILQLKKDFSKKLEDAEHLNFTYKSQIFDFENTIKADAAKYTALKTQYEQLESEYQNFRNEITKKNSNERSQLLHNNHQLLDEIKQMKKENKKLSIELETKTANCHELILSTKAYHSIILDLLLKIIDPVSTGKVIDACSNIDGNSKFSDILKVFAITDNYEIESLSAILDNYQAILKERDTRNLQARNISELQGEVTFLTQKINDLETMKDSETVRIHELETQNAKLREIVNEKVDKMDKLKRLRLDDLNKKWKAAEEALSQTKKGAQLKIAELEQELNTLKAEINQDGNS